MFKLKCSLHTLRRPCARTEFPRTASPTALRDVSTTSHVFPWAYLGNTPERCISKSRLCRSGSEPRTHRLGYSGGGSFLLTLLRCWHLLPRKSDSRSSPLFKGLGRRGLQKSSHIMDSQTTILTSIVTQRLTERRCQSYSFTPLVESPPQAGVAGNNPTNPIGTGGRPPKIPSAKQTAHHHQRRINQ